jgi:hypothetical protein
VGDQTVIRDLERLRDAEADVAVRAAVVQAISDIKKRLGLKGASIDNAAAIVDASMKVSHLNFSWLRGTFFKTSLKKVEAPVSLAFNHQKAWTRRDFLQGMGALAGLALVTAMGCTKDPGPEDLEDFLIRLVMQDPKDATESSMYQEILKMGPGIWVDLKAFAQDPNRDTNARKWALRLIGEVADLNNMDAIDYLKLVINDQTTLYEWWHKQEAKNGLTLINLRRYKAGLPLVMAISGMALPSNDAAMKVLLTDFSWLSRRFFKAPLKDVGMSEPLALNNQKAWTRLDFFKGMGALAGLALLTALGCAEDEQQSVEDEVTVKPTRKPKDLLGSLGDLTMTDPPEAMGSNAYKDIIAMGPSIWIELKKFADDKTRNTNSRKWALRLIGEVAALNDQEAVDYLKKVINDRTDLYEWWHRWEAQEGLGIFNARRVKAGLGMVGMAGSGIVLKSSDAAEKRSDLGGIDMNDITVRQSGIGSDIQFNTAMIDRVLSMRVEGFAPVVISLTPVDSVLRLLK